MVNHRSVCVRVKVLTNRTTIMVDRASLAYVSMYQSFEGQAKVKLKYGLPLHRIQTVADIKINI